MRTIPLLVVLVSAALAIVAMGLPFVDVMDLEAVAQVASRLKRWEFLLTTAPVPVLGGTGFPLNPIATF